MRISLLTRTFPFLIISSFLLGGCAQMTRHSNTLVFGTDSTIGVAAGQGASQTPKLDIGYARKEFAFVPVLANTKAEGRMLGPCPEAVVEKCNFQAEYFGVVRDSYSTLASFGSDVGVEGGTNAKVSIAQYFATGVAAQLLAVSGGANIVSAGGDTAAKAKAAEKTVELEKSKVELQIEKERNNAAAQIVRINDGKSKATEILGDVAQPVDPAKRKTLADEIDMPACNDSYLATLDQSSVEKFLADLDAKRSQCLAELGSSEQE